MAFLKSKDIYIALKRDDCMSYLMERFGFPQEEELFEAIRRVIPSDAEEVIKKLIKKQKRSDRRVRATAIDLASTPNDVQTVQETEEVEDKQLDDTDQGSEQEVQDVNLLEQLKVQEQELSAKVCRLEGTHKELVSKRRGLVEGLEKAQRALKELRRILNEQELNVTSLYDQYNACAEEMRGINQERRVCRDLLEETRRQITELQKVMILVYSDGNIEVENGEVPAISEEEIVPKFGRLIGMPEAGEITINEVKTIAKLQMMVKVYESNSYTFELVFDSSKLQKFWETVTA